MAAPNAVATPLRSCSRFSSPIALRTRSARKRDHNDAFKDKSCLRSERMTKARAEDETQESESSADGLPKDAENEETWESSSESSIDGSSDSCYDEDGRENGHRHACKTISDLVGLAHKVVIAALAGPPHDSSHRQRERTVAQAMEFGCTNVQNDYWGDSSDIPAHGRACFAVLKEHQRVGVRWLMALHSHVPGMIIADEMGLGKTLETLCFLECLASEKPSLVIAPASLLDNWEAEVARWTPALTTLKYHCREGCSRQDLRKEYFLEPSRYNVVIATPQSVSNREDRASFFKHIQFEYLICDEAHSLRNSSTNVFRHMHKAVNCQKRLLLTGTPIQNSLEELATLVGFALSTYDDFLYKHLQHISKSANGRALRQLQAIVTPLVLRRLKVDVLPDLPPKRCRVIYCDMDDKQRALYEEELDTSRRLHQEGGENPKDSITLQAYWGLLRMCLHPLMAQTKFSIAERSSIVDLVKENFANFQAAPRDRVARELEKWSDFDIHVAAGDCAALSEFRASTPELLASAKMTELFRILEQQLQAGSKTLVFSQYTTLLDVTGAALAASGIRFCRLDGSTDVAERHALVSDFQSDEKDILVFLLTTKAGGVGLNLSSANVVVILDLDFNPQNTLQAEDRAHRLGQGRDVTVYYLVCRGTVEDIVLRRNTRKMHLDTQFGGRRTALDAVGGGRCAGDPSAEAKECRQAVMAELKALLRQAPKPKKPQLGDRRSNAAHLTSAAEEDVPLSFLVAESSSLPDDAPPGHVSFSRVRFDEKKALVFFKYREFGQETHFQVTTGQAGSRRAAEVIARACYMKFEEGWSKEQVVNYKRHIFGMMESARSAVVATLPPVAASGAALACKDDDAPQLPSQNMNAGCEPKPCAIELEGELVYDVADSDPEVDVDDVVLMT